MSSLTVAAPAPARARGQRPFWRLARTEALLFARSAMSVAWAALIPVLAIIVLGAVPGTRHHSASYGGLSPLEVYLPILMCWVFVMSATNLLPPVLAGYRDRGILRRLATTPVPPARLLGAQALIYLGLGVVIDAIMLVLAICFGVPVPRQFAGLVLALLLVAAATISIGLLITALAPSEKVANTLGMVAFFPLIFFAGLWIPRQKMPGVLRTISDYTPLGAGVRAVQSSLEGRWPATAALLVLVTYSAVCGLVAARRFRWQ
jgi:ABC-2 type transport system permease protein